MESIELLIRFDSDYPLLDLYSISDRLTEDDICVPGYIPPQVGLYHPDGYFYEQECEGIQWVLLPDRNVVSRFAQLAQGKVVCDDWQLRMAAALLAFVQCLDIEIEPSIAFHELAHKSGNQAALEELAWFRAADNANPHDVIAVALARKDALSAKYAAHEVGEYDLAKPLKRWNRNYILALKMMELEQCLKKPLDRVLSLLDWMRDEFIFGGPAALLASVYFAPNSSPKKRVFKDKNAADREKAIAGVRNAAWDLTHLSEFIRHVNDQGPEGKKRYVFASFDRHLRLMANLMFRLNLDKSAPSAMQSALSQWWPPSDAAHITTTIFGHLHRIQSSDWKEKTTTYPDFIGERIRDGERRIREMFSR